MNHFQLPKIDFAKYNLDIKLDDDDMGRDKADNNETTVRGRIFDQTKPETFNQVPHDNFINTKSPLYCLCDLVVDMRRTTSSRRVINRISTRAD